MSSLEKTELQLGYIPLLDCIALLWAKQRGFFDEVGLNVTLTKEASWASLRDRLAFGLLDTAHCLSAMLPAAAIGADQIGIQLQTPLVLSENRAFISLSQKLCYQLGIKQQDPVDVSAKKLIEYIKAIEKALDKEGHIPNILRDDKEAHDLSELLKKVDLLTKKLEDNDGK